MVIPQENAEKPVPAWHKPIGATSFGDSGQRFRIRDGKFKKLGRFGRAKSQDQVLKGTLGLGRKGKGIFSIAHEFEGEDSSLVLVRRGK